jgi:two-component sensor histidine kinase
VVSELVTNAVHASSIDGRYGYDDDGRVLVVGVRLQTDGKTVVIEVWDQADGEPEVKSADLQDEEGRGLALVEQMSARWAWFRADDTSPFGKCVWAELA